MTNSSEAENTQPQENQVHDEATQHDDAAPRGRSGADIVVPAVPGTPVPAAGNTSQIPNQAPGADA